jgi:hypothetical protein
VLLNLQKYSLGVGDRFGRQGPAQLRAVQMAERAGVVVAPVWNKSFREHTLLGTSPDDVRAEADAAVRRGGWTHPYHVDADHVGVKTVDGFLAACDFYTLDVADHIGQPPGEGALAAFVRDMGSFRGALHIPGLDATFQVDDGLLEEIGRRYLRAAMEAGKTYHHVLAARGEGTFITEVSTDEATAPQLPVELFFILGALAHEKVPVQTIAPRFSGKFLKGVDYVGDAQAFARELDADLAVVAHAVSVFGLPPALKISVHSGSDKPSLYPIIHRALMKHGAGLHLKTAGTTWLEEVAGVTLSGPRGLAVAKRVLQLALPRFDELVKPYATVVEIDRARLPSPATVEAWSAGDLVNRLRHDRSHPAYDANLRQFVHIAFRVAAEMGLEWTDALDGASEIAASGVTENLFDRHIRPLFLGG